MKICDKGRLIVQKLMPAVVLHYILLLLLQA
jgi:hypothetical protein